MLSDLSSVFDGLIQRVLQVLPTSPLREFIDSMGDIPYLSYLNWFFPVSEIIAVLSLWITAIGLFYLWSVVLRWLRVIGG